MAAAERVFVYKFGSSRVRCSNMVPLPPEIDIPDTPDLSILRFDVKLLDEKSTIAAQSKRWSTAETQSAVIFYKNDKETGF